MFFYREVSICWHLLLLLFTRKLQKHNLFDKCEQTYLELLFWSVKEDYDSLTGTSWNPVILLMYYLAY